MKKTIIIIGIILGIIAMAIGIYFAWKKSRQILTPPVIIEQPITDIQRLPALAEEKLKILSVQPVFDYWIYQTTINEIFYFNQTGQIFKIGENGENEAVTDKPIENIQSIKSSADGKYVLIEFGDRNLTEFLIFNSETRIFQTLPNNTSAADFSPDGKQIAYLNKTDLFVKDLVGARPKTLRIISFNQKDFNLEWILPEIVVLTSKPSAFADSFMWSLNIRNRTFQLLSPQGIRGLMVKWSVDAGVRNKLGLQFDSRLRGRESSLILINEKGERRANLDFLTLPDKCYFFYPLIYCAVPLEISPRTVLPDDYLKRTFYSNDFIYQINIIENSFAEVFRAGDPVIDAIRLKLNDGNLLFINRYDNKLYQLER